jgi:hypothetical protein
VRKGGDLERDGEGWRGMEWEAEVEVEVKEKN